MGDEVVGDVSSLQYSAALTTPKNEAFVKAYRAKYGKVPSYFSESNYTTAQLIDETIKKLNGKFPGAEQFVKTMAALTVDAPRGPVSFDDMRNPIQNIYIKKVEKKKMFGNDKDELWNTVINPIRTSASSGSTARISSSRSRYTAATIRHANIANDISELQRPSARTRARGRNWRRQCDAHLVPRHRFYMRAVELGNSAPGPRADRGQQHQHQNRRHSGRPNRNAAARGFEH